MSYVKYNGKEKYHFRWYRKTQNHPFLVTLVVEEKDELGKVLISGFNITSSIVKVLERPNRFIKLDANPNPESDLDTYVNITLVKDQPSKLFSRPIRRWKLKPDDVKKIDELLNALK